MSSNTKIVVLRSKELVYALIFFVLSVLIIITALSVFSSKDDTTDETSDDVTISSLSQNSQSLAIYVPGKYSSVVSLGSTNMELTVTVDSDHINSITMSNIDETVETMYPLIEPTLSELASAIIADQSTDNITYADETRYTSMLLMQAIDEALSKAKITDAQY